MPVKKRFRILKRVLLSLLVIIVIFLIVVALQPAEYRVTRSATIAAPQPVVFAQVNDFHKWEAWSPWAKLDPAAKNTFEGPTAGAGAKFSWSGNDKAGEGKMTIAESKPADLVRIDLEFIRPFPDKCLTEFTFRPDGNQTAVTWTMSGRKNFMSKAVCMFMSMDKMVGGDFEKGLASLKSVSESAAK